jgi:hypothetical protein
MAAIFREQTVSSTDRSEERSGGNFFEDMIYRDIELTGCFDDLKIFCVQAAHPNLQSLHFGNKPGFNLERLRRFTGNPLLSPAELQHVAHPLA